MGNTGITKEMKDRNMYHHMEVPSTCYENNGSGKNLRFRNNDSIRTEESAHGGAEYKELEDAFSQLKVKSGKYEKEIALLKEEIKSLMEVEIEIASGNGSVDAYEKKLV